MCIKKTIVLSILTLLTGYVSAQPEIWRDPSVFRINKEAAHAEYTEYTSRDDALKPLNLENPWNSSVYQSLPEPLLLWRGS